MSLGLIDGGSLLPVSSMLESREKIFLYWFLLVCVKLLDIRRKFFSWLGAVSGGLCERQRPLCQPSDGRNDDYAWNQCGERSVTREAGLRWLEKTGFLIKVDEVRAMAVKGRRRRECGCIELYVNKET